MPDFVDPMEKAETRTLSLPRGDWEYLALRGKETKSDRSKYVRSLIARDRAAISSELDALSRTILVDLCSKLRPEIASRLSRALEKAPFSFTRSPRMSREEIDQLRIQSRPDNQQVRILADLIVALLDYAEDRGSFFSTPLSIVSANRLPIEKLIKEALDKYDDTLCMALEKEGEEYVESIKREMELMEAIWKAIRVHTSPPYARNAPEENDEASAIRQNAAVLDRQLKSLAVGAKAAAAEQAAKERHEVEVPLDPQPYSEIKRP
jgi:hypothetical protein